MATEKDELRKVFDEHAVEGHVVKDELVAMCMDLDRPLKTWELEAAWRSMDHDEVGWVVRMAPRKRSFDPLQSLHCLWSWANRMIAS